MAAGFHHGVRLRSEQVLQAGSDWAGGMDYFVWAITNTHGTVVVDTGFSEDEGTRRGRTFLRSPVLGLAEIGIDATQVEHVVLTHFHYDHIGGQALFPRATFHVQEE